MANGTKILETESEVKIILDPFRTKIWVTYIYEKESLTVKQVADILGEVPSKIHYHVQKLIGIGILELDYTKNINGIIAKYYKAKYDNYEISDNVQNNEFFDRDSTNLVAYNHVCRKMRKNIVENKETDTFKLGTGTLSLTEETATKLLAQLRELFMIYAKKEDNDIGEEKIDFSYQIAILKHTK